MDHLTTDQLNAGLYHIQAAPSDTGTVEMVVSRPRTDEREVLDVGELVVAEGLAGDNYLARGGKLPEDPAHPEAQINIMNSRVIDVITNGDKDRWQLAGDQLLVDFDLSVDNAPPGTRLQVGGAVLEVSQKPHRGCAKFAARFGQDAVRWVNSEAGTHQKLRGLNAMVITAGTVKPGDTVTKLA
jgi:MOSC domain-containing protein YiiM